ncbi:effector-associated constant component EACC1 [Streptomyces sp. enrichment culture]|uniref:effector-associated constant component EACC1 n=1 Tax=Streptomyces sp. enrichment culture TaxID=1795815 RepID=UPI003F549B81
MEVTLSSTGPDGGKAAATGELHRWLQRQPELRGRLVRQSAAAPQPGTMGASGELLTLLLAPGGLTAALGAAVVAWLQNRRGDQTVTITLPDQTQITVSATKVRGLTAQATGDLARSIAATVEASGRTPDGAGGRNTPRDATVVRDADGPAGNSGERV